MLGTLFSLCKRGEPCSKTVEEETQRVRNSLTKSKYDIVHYEETHPLYDHYSKFIQKRAKDFSEIICRGAVSPEYIAGAQNREPILTVARGLKTDGTVEYKGFAQSLVNKYFAGTELHIFTICTSPGSGLGKAIIDNLESFVKKRMKLNFITLESVDDAIEFYEKIGFDYANRYPGLSEDLTPMIKKVGGYSPLKYFTGLSSRKKTQRRKEISKFGKMSSKNPKAYVGFSTDKNIKTRRSNYTAKFKSMFPKANSLTQKSKATGVPVGYLKKSYDRGMAAWRTGHRPGATQQQWGYARVHSLLTCGKTYDTTDSDIVKDAKRRSKTARRWFNRCK